MTNSNTIIHGTYFKDQIKWLVVCGIIQIIIGVVAALSIFLGGIIITISPPDDNGFETMSTAIVIFSVIIGYFMAGWNIFNGIGSIKARRWARELIYISSWIEIFRLIYLTLGSILWFIFTPIPRYVFDYLITWWFLKAILSFIIPVIFVLFYGSDSVKATCRFRDTQVRWNDKYPFLVAAAILSYAACIISPVLANMFL